MASDIAGKISAVEAAIAKKTASLSECISMINQLKIDLTTLPGLQPGVTFTEDNLKHVVFARDVYELATLLSVQDEDEEAFERHVSRVKTYYVDFIGVLQPSRRQNLILGLNLMRLLAQNRIAEFHTELELVPVELRSDRFISYALTLEQYVMEGSYSRISSARDAVPDMSFMFFLNTLMDTMREKIAACGEKAYNQISVEAAAKMLSFRSSAELAAFCEERQWRIEGNTVYFSPDISAASSISQVPSMELIGRSLDYARELEQII